MTRSSNKRTDAPNRIHLAVLEGQHQLQQGRISRREFLRLATLLGLGLPAANVLAACGTPATSAPAATSVPAATNAPAPTSVPATAAPLVKRGGTLTLFVNGKAAGSCAAPEFTTTQAKDCALGGNPHFTGNEFLATRFADFSVFARALSEAEIQAMAEK